MSRGVGVNRPRRDPCCPRLGCCGGCPATATGQRSGATCGPRWSWRCSPGPVGRLRPRSWWWLLLPAAQAALPLAGRPWSLVKTDAEVGLLLAVLVVAVGALDPRPAIAAAVYLVPGLLYAAESIAEGAPSTLALGYWMLLAVLTATLAAAAWRIRRQQLTQR
jgi:hypothetical protein